MAADRAGGREYAGAGGIHDPLPLGSHLIDDQAGGDEKASSHRHT